MKALLAYTVALGVLLAAPAMAQWQEQGDAGDLPGTAQVPVGGGPLATISGTFLASDADMYCIRIDSPSAFTATTCNGTTADTQLFLFRENGTGVSHNDDDPGGCGLQSTVTGAFVTAPGQYLLAVSVYNRDPVGAGGCLIWANSPFNVERAPDGACPASPIAAWTGSTSTTGAYTIRLTGTSYCGATAVEPTTWGAIKNTYK
jgi:hypothetical protein